jgi:hypothetical protein
MANELLGYTLGKSVESLRREFKAKNFPYVVTKIKLARETPKGKQYAIYGHRRKA